MRCAFGNLGRTCVDIIGTVWCLLSTAQWALIFDLRASIVMSPKVVHNASSILVKQVGLKEIGERRVNLPQAS
jgi:hypothetical protein